MGKRGRGHFATNASPELGEFLKRYRLPRNYAETAQRWFVPLAEALATCHKRAGRPLTVGINGSQGSGKSTLAALLCLLLEQQHGLAAVDISIDDFYLSHAQRHKLAHTVHPLLATRGVPGTHDVGLMVETLERLTRSTGSLAIPRFDKASDDPFPSTDWPRISAPLDLVIVEGWCLGTPPQAEEDLAAPVNRLEAEEDTDGRWRRYVNRRIAERYQPLYKTFDAWIMLEAPSFDCVYHWRLEQERKLADRLGDGGRNSRVMDEHGVRRFIEHFQRLTEYSLAALPQQAHFLYRLDEDRAIVSVSCPRPLGIRGRRHLR